MADDDSKSLSWLGNLQQQINNLADEQRMERLQQCRKLESTLKVCKEGKPDRQQLEDFPEGIRMTRYFDFRNNPGKNCQRETHAVWACRAISLSCGADLVELRKCFVRNDMLNQSNTSYEGDFDVPCKEFQKRVGECVAREASELEQRRKARR